MICNRLALLAPLVLTIACKGGEAPSARAGDSVTASGTPATAAASNQPQTVAVVDAGAPNTTYALVAGACVEKSCAARVELRVAGKPVNAVPLAFAASSATLTASPSDASFATNATFTTYAAGEEEGAVTTLVQAVRLSPRRTGLLVQQAGGFEHVKRRRDLFVIENNRLNNVWSKQDGNGPVRSFVDVIRNADIDNLVLIEGITLTPAEADQITAFRLSWDEGSKSLQSSPIATLKAVAIGNFATAELARAKYADACLANYWTVSASQIGETPKHFTLAFLSADSAAATHNASNRDCSPKDARRTVDFRLTNNNQR